MGEKHGGIVRGGGNRPGDGGLDVRGVIVLIPSEI